MGGKNSFWRKPGGTGKGSVNSAGKSAFGKGTWDSIGKAYSDASKQLIGGGGSNIAFGSTGSAVNSLTGTGLAGKEGQKFGLAGLFNAQGGQEKSINSLSQADIMRFLKAGAEEGELIAGATKAEVGKGRADVRGTLQERLAGNSAGANALAQDNAQAQRTLKATQMMSGGGQMNAGQQQALARQGSRDLANLRSNEQRQTLADLSKEFRGAGSDIMRSEGQYGSVLVGAQQPPQMKQSSGPLSGLLDGVSSFFA